MGGRREKVKKELGRRKKEVHDLPQCEFKLETLL